jgi:hypothetical protein
MKFIPLLVIAGIPDLLPSRASNGQISGGVGYDAGCNDVCGPFHGDGGRR